MQTIKSEYIKTDEAGKDWWRVIIVSDTTPDSFELDGSDVDGMADDAGIAAGSVLITPSSNYIAFEDGVFTAKGEGGGGGGGGEATVILSYDGNDTYAYFVGATIEEMNAAPPTLVSESEYTLTITQNYYFSVVNASVASYSGDITFDEDNYCYQINGDGAFSLQMPH